MKTSKNNLKTITINVEEKPTGNISRCRCKNGGSFAFNVSENNWLGQGKVGFNAEVDEERIKGTLSYEDPNYDFLGNSLNYSISSTNNDVPDKFIKTRFYQLVLERLLSNIKILQRH